MSILIRGGLAAAAAAALFTGGSGGSASAQQPGGDAASEGDWQVLFDGTGLEGWEQIGDANWRLEDGAVRADSGQGHLISAESYADFELQVEFWVSADANSGVFLRCAERVQINPDTCYEINVFDQRPDPTYRTGSIVEVAPPQAQVDAAERWNTFEITADGPRLTVVLNGTTTVDIEDGTHQQGPLTLQYGAGTVMFRSVRLREL